MSVPRRRLLLAAGITLAVLVLAGVTLAFLGSAPRGDAGGLFSIEKGWTLSRISRELQARGFVRAGPLLEAIGRLRGTQAAFKAGYYRIPAGSSVLRVHDLLVQGAQTLGRVTIPEGWTLGKIAWHLEAQGICRAEEFLAAAQDPSVLSEFPVTAKTMEGYLFPDTYFIPRPFPARTMVELMGRTFFSVLDEVAPGWKDLSPRSLEDKVILASIVEREYQVAEEAGPIASVFVNRLAKNIGLESCATLEYIITEIQRKPHPEYITLDDKKIDSPYNTYMWAGLPPGAISNPGRTALTAAFRPPRTDYYYFVLRDPAAGRHYFSRDLGAHNQAKNLYLKKP